MVMRDAGGKFVVGHKGIGTKPKAGQSLSDLIRLKFGEEIAVYVDKKLTKVERRELMAEYLAQLISTGEIRIPPREIDGQLVDGKTFRYNGDEYMQHLIRVLRYLEPPVQQVDLNSSVSGVIFDKEIDDGGE